MDVQDVIPEAIGVVLGWDLPDEVFADAVEAQAGALARVNLDEFRGSSSD